MLVNSRPALFYTVVTLTIILAYFGSIYPIATEYQILRPELVCLLVIYWVMSVPLHLGVSFAFFVGLFQDLIEQSVWGAHALALTFVAYFCARSYKRIKGLAVWQQSVWVFVLVGMHQVLVNIVLGFAGYNTAPRDLLISVVVTSLTWPVLMLVILRVRLAYRMV
ncbi:MAG: rod shape-determining protein MreD [Flavobacteriales bacterium]|jgi:rod shape-determining protein MreD